MYPALALARALESRHKSVELIYLGTQAGMEAKLVPAAGLQLYTIDARAFPRTVSFELVGALIAGARGLWQARRLIRRLQPDVVVGMGAYASVPAVLAGRMLRIPIVIHEQNAIPGVANRFLSRFADAVAVSYEESARWFSSRVVWTGNPVREEILRIAKEQSLEVFSLDPRRKTLLAFGGSRGARHINEAVAGAYGALRNAGGLQIIHLTGTIEFDAVKGLIDRQRKDGDTLIYRPLPYLDDMGVAYSAADLVLSRAGATTIAELTARGLPALLVPYPHATARHQEENARALREAGGARMIADAELTPERLVEVLDEQLDERVLAEMGKRAKKLGRPDAALRLAELVAGLARKATATPGG